MPSDSKSRFSNRVEDYVKYRPGYPMAIAEYLEKEYAVSSSQLIADIGAGTGISSELFLRLGYAVMAVEPNSEMLSKAIELLSVYPKFKPVIGSAEATTLQGHSVDVVLSGQAFHWFNAQAAKIEFSRILRKNGLVVLMWNERKTSSDFEKEYDRLIAKHSKDYVQIDHRNIDMNRIQEFFSPASCRLEIFSNEQRFDFAGLEGRLLSSSYIPFRTDPGFDSMIADMKSLFDRFQKGGQIVIQYDTKVYVGNFTFAF